MGLSGDGILDLNLTSMLTASGSGFGFDFIFGNSTEGSGPAPVPEPGTLVLMVFGLVGLMMYQRFKEISYRR